jgi:hypothetical protein
MGNVTFLYIKISISTPQAYYELRSSPFDISVTTCNYYSL